MSSIMGSKEPRIWSRPAESESSHNTSDCGFRRGWQGKEGSPSGHSLTGTMQGNVLGAWHEELPGSSPGKAACQRFSLTLF